MIGDTGNSSSIRRASVGREGAGSVGEGLHSVLHRLLISGKSYRRLVRSTKRSSERGNFQEEESPPKR